MKASCSFRHLLLVLWAASRIVFSRVQNSVEVISDLLAVGRGKILLVLYGIHLH